MFEQSGMWSRKPALHMEKLCLDGMPAPHVPDTEPTEQPVHDNQARTPIVMANEQLIGSYIEWGMDYIDRGFEPYLLTAKFNPLLGSSEAVGKQMMHAVERAYGIMLTHHFRRPKKEHIADLPFWIVAEDWPVPKRDRDHIHDVVPNDGRHMHALAFKPPNSRMRGCMADYLEDHQSLYSGRNRPIWHLHGERITYDEGKAMGYGLKALTRGWIDNDAVTVLPRRHKEMRGQWD
ncbi:hypothetical protein [Pararhizobium mangrovi]|uniref:Uncharacterized protein n=1 Tax=Pararhizobium mangrovi TaxID=2590452 RepID=A0A506TXT3_9HYPH|nr:hypothetical protein [Pararhizobium mangrovi]TPW25998.1 hypothetical protein FJU11_16810 [Pararhizobium mangrovi]